MHAKVRHPCLFFQFELVDVDVCEDICGGAGGGLTLGLKAMSLRTISTVKTVVKTIFRMSIT